MRRVKKFSGFINESKSFGPVPYKIEENGDILINLRSRKDVDVSEDENEFKIAISVGDSERKINIPKKAIDLMKYQDTGIIRIVGESKWGFSDENTSDVYDFLYDFSDTREDHLDKEEDSVDYISMILSVLKINSDMESIETLGDGLFNILLKNGGSINIGIHSDIMGHLRAYKDTDSANPYIDIDRKRNGSSECLLSVCDDIIKIDFRSIKDLTDNPIFDYIVTDSSNGSVEKARSGIVNAITDLREKEGSTHSRSKELSDLIKVAEDFMESEEIEELIK